METVGQPIPALAVDVTCSIVVEPRYPLSGPEDTTDPVESDGTVISTIVKANAVLFYELIVRATESSGDYVMSTVQTFSLHPHYQNKLTWNSRGAGRQEAYYRRLF
ncbi:hypothetical protein HAX54_036134, partial [Datura stramonium]|nr:hypothetical protein [Datura stramonium]